MNDGETDILLMQKIASGDTAAARVLVLKWQKPLINFFYRSLNNIHSAEDLAQQTFINLLRNAEKYTPEAAFPAYLFRIAHNILISDFRSRSRKNAEATDPAELPAVADNADPIAQNELKKSFADAVERLPENHRTAILLFCQQELSYSEIAETMNTSVSNVKNWVHRARQALRNSLSAFLEH